MRAAGWIFAGLLSALLLSGGCDDGADELFIVTLEDDSPQFFFGHDNLNHTLIEINLETGRGRTVGSTGFDSGASGLTTSRAEVVGPDGERFPAGTHFGLLRDNETQLDWVVALDTTSGVATRVVETSREIGGRGVAFGPDGATLFVIERSGALSTIDVATGVVRAFARIDFECVSLTFDPERAYFFGLANATLIRIDPWSGVAEVVGEPDGLGALQACALARSPGGEWYTVDNLTGEVVTLDVDAGRVASVKGALGSAVSWSICGMAFAPERVLD